MSSFPVHVGTTNSERQAMRSYYKDATTPEEMSKASGMELERCKILWPLLATPTIALDLRVDDKSSVADTLASATPSPVELLMSLREEQARQKFVKKALRLLTEKERKVINRRLLSESPQTLDEIGADLGCSREWVRQIEAQALKKIREGVRRPAELRASL